MKLKTVQEFAAGFQPAAQNVQGDVLGFVHEPLGSKRFEKRGPAIWRRGSDEPEFLQCPAEDRQRFGSPQPLTLNDKGICAGILLENPRPPQKPFAPGPPVYYAASRAFVWEPRGGFSIVEVPEARIQHVVLTNDNVLAVTASYSLADYERTYDNDAVWPCPFTGRTWAPPYVLPSAQRFIKSGGTWKLEIPDTSGPLLEARSLGDRVVEAYEEKDPLSRPRGYMSWALGANASAQLLVALNVDASAAIPGVWPTDGKLEVLNLADGAAATKFAQPLSYAEDGTLVVLDAADMSGKPAETHLRIYFGQSSTVLRPPPGVFKIDALHTVVSPSGRFIATAGTLRTDRDTTRVPIIWEKVRSGEYSPAVIPELAPTWFRFVCFSSISESGLAVYRLDDVWEDGPASSFAEPHYILASV